MRKVLAIGLLRPATLPLLIVEVTVVDLLRPANIPLVMTDDMLVDVYIGNKRPSTLSLAIKEQYLKLKGEVNIDLIPATITLINKVIMVDC